ncbi:MAG: DUF2279 domain-containing protein [Saprospiraceae bacterium]|nr:DUF2279 domain-containing protein [Saprospiraceae bacterium]
MTRAAKFTMRVCRLCRQRVELKMRAAGLALLLSLCVGPVQSQDQHWLLPADTLNKGRFWTATAVSTTLYTGTVIGLSTIWYDQYARTRFHFFNDWGEWKNMDKFGHLYTAYFESQWVFSIARWTGIKPATAAWVGAGAGVLLQGTIEVLDGYSEQWGFSIPDFAFNLLGASTFLTQHFLWNEQRILLKVSGLPTSYPDLEIRAVDNGHTTTLRQRTNSLYGTGFFERFIKDYNTQTVWASMNVAAFLPQTSRWPAWLNVAIGYGAEHMYGGFENRWEENGVIYEITRPDYSRYSQFYLAPDIDFSRIPSRSPLIRTLLGMLNVFKFPSPAIEFNRIDGVRLHAIHF